MVDPREKQAYLTATPHQREVVRLGLLNVLAVLRAQGLGYQNSHWQVVGSAFHSDHLLFERLYHSVQPQIDELAEKIAGYLGSETLGLGAQLKVVTAYCARWTTLQCHHRRGIQSEEDLQTAVKMAYDSIKGVEAMTLGMDDWLMATASRHEQNTYLLQQALATPSTEAREANVEPVAPSAEGAFLLPESSEVREFAESGGVTNVPEVASEAAPELDIPRSEAVADAEAGPPTPVEIAAEPGGGELSTLNRYVVESEEPETALAVTPNRELMADWLDELS